MGEARREQLGSALTEIGGEEAMVVDTLGGRMHVHWDEGASAT